MYPGGKGVRYPVGRRPQNRCESSGKKKYFCPFREGNLVVQPERNHYVDWAISAKQAQWGAVNFNPSNSSVTKSD